MFYTAFQSFPEYRHTNEGLLNYYFINTDKLFEPKLY
jgi:hypothetical protein